MNPKVSIVVPVYNVEKYLVECLDSLLNQTLKDIEIITINDGSKDDSLKILEEYREKHSNIRVIDKKNEGLSATRNVGIEKSYGEYIIFIDSDDMLEKTALEKLYNLCIENNLDIATYDAMKFDEISNSRDEKIHSRKDIFKKSVLTNEEFMEGSIKKGMIQAPFHFYKRSFIIDNNLRFEKGILHEDELFSMNCYQYINKIGYINEQFYIRRFRANSIMSSNIYKNEKSLNSYIFILSEFNKLIRKNLNNEPFIKFAKSRGSLLMCNLIRYKDFNFKNLLELKDKEGFKLDWVRITYNIVKF